MFVSRLGLVINIEHGAETRGTFCHMENSVNRTYNNIIQHLYNTIIILQVRPEPSILR